VLLAAPSIEKAGEKKSSTGENKRRKRNEGGFGPFLIYIA